MRFFSVFFAFYLALLACLPCADAVPATTDSARTYVSAADHNSDSPGHVDWCSPLCQCHCCSGTSLPSATILAFASTPRAYEASPRFARLASAAARQRPGSIWQPPQA
jgi:hypothetical protein